jgi:thiosulfate/3-mercaptopyruvate sulfurtransferase
MALPIISAQDLDPTRVTLLDVRWQPAEGAQPDLYASGHIPGAVFIDLDRDLASPPGPRGRHPLPAAEDFAAAMRAAGVSAGTRVVAYDDANGLAAARAWWLLRYFGHEQVSVLDGGLSAWIAAGGELAQGEETPDHEGTFRARPGAMPILDAEGAGRLATTGVLLDARAPDRYRGESEPLDRVAGHIPGARNRPIARNLDGDGRLLAPAELREAFAELADAEVGTYCGSGISAAQTVLALELAGIQAALYPGSWSEWVTDPDRPVATGDEP